MQQDINMRRFPHIFVKAAERKETKAGALIAYICFRIISISMSSRAPFLLVLIILVTAGVTTALFTVKRAAAQPS
ncbi:MAG: hypothetical protein WAZ77_17300, partial [Candidatus Nitrosopolaris sp.]